MWKMKSNDNNFKDDILSKTFFFLEKNGNDDIQRALTMKVGDFLPKCMNMNTSNVMTWRP